MPKKTTNHHYAVIMAGGSGTRMWPMSRKNSPKQFHAIFSSQTMLQLMYQLLREVFTPDHIYVQTDKKFIRFVEEQLSELPRANILLEPQARDTAPAFGYATAMITRKDEQAKIGAFYSDHIIKNKQNFVKAVKTAFQAIEDFPNDIVLIGVNPAYPHTGLGYIQMGNQAKDYTDGEVFRVERFIEKPDVETAETFVKSWEYLWNTGYKVYDGANFFKIMREMHPGMVKTFDKISKVIDQEGSEQKVAELYAELPRISFEYLITEKVQNLLVIPSDMEWSDIGDWKSLHDMLIQVNGHHMIARGNHVGLNCENCLIFGGERMVATLGLKDIIIVDMGDVLLVANKHQAQDIKKLVGTLEEQDKHVYL